jgi:hypothetical protein
MAMSVKDFNIVDNKRTPSDVWADFGLKRMKLDDAIEREMAITQYVSVRIAIRQCRIAIRFLQAIGATLIIDTFGKKHLLRVVSGISWTYFQKKRHCPKTCVLNQARFAWVSTQVSFLQIVFSENT